MFLLFLSWFAIISAGRLPSSLLTQDVLMLVPVNGQLYSCPGGPVPQAPIITAPGFLYAPVVANLSYPRGITLDSRGNILVVELDKGISAHTVDENGCVTSSKLIVANNNLTNGLDVHLDRLYARSV